MFDKFGEFDSVEEINRAAAAQKAEGDEEALKILALENGLEEMDAEDYMDGCESELTTPLMAALGKLKVESQYLKLDGIMKDWKSSIEQECVEDERLQRAVRSKAKSLAGCMACMIRFSFENKIQVSNNIVNITKVRYNGKEEDMKKPLYIGTPNKKQVRKIIAEYYLE